MLAWGILYQITLCQGSSVKIRYAEKGFTESGSIDFGARSLKQFDFDANFSRRKGGSRCQTPLKLADLMAIGKQAAMFDSMSYRSAMSFVMMTMASM